MVGKIKINVERCKGCRLCVTVCPNGCIGISDSSNSKGYFPAEMKNENCIGCAACAIICPDAVIEVYLDSDNTKTTKTPGKKKSTLSGEKL